MSSMMELMKQDVIVSQKESTRKSGLRSSNEVPLIARMLTQARLIS